MNVDGNWGDEDDIIDIDTDPMLAGASNDNAEGGADENEDGAGGDIFVPPSLGPDPLHAALKLNPLISGLYVATGDFGKAMEILKKQLAISNFGPMKQIFVDVFTLGKFKIQTLPHILPQDYQLRTNGGLSPFIAINLQNIKHILNTGIESTTKGDFNSALDTFRKCL